MRRPDRRKKNLMNTEKKKKQIAKHIMRDFNS